MSRHFNKYEAQSRAAQKRRQEEKMCTRKHQYSTRDDAEQPGQRVYLCPFCEMWHRSGSLATLVASVRGTG